MNPQRDRGIRAEREACTLLAGLLGLDVKRRANEGIREDISDLIGLPDTAIQVSACQRNDTAIAARARTKVIDCGTQQARLGARHGVTLLRVDGSGSRPAIWRALLSFEQVDELRRGDVISTNPRNTIGNVIRTCTGWELASFKLPGIVCAPVETWAAQWSLTAGRTAA